MHVARDGFLDGIKIWPQLSAKERDKMFAEIRKQIAPPDIPRLHEIEGMFKDIKKSHARPTSIFLSHSSIDKPFVRKLGDSLAFHGFKVWLDEAELKIGDSLIEAISEAVFESDYIVAVISKSSVRSNWVKKELSLAMTQEIRGRSIKVLPVLASKVALPLHLQDKLYVDMTDPKRWRTKIPSLVRSLSSSAESSR